MADPIPSSWYTFPLTAPPAGQTSNFVDPPDRQNSVYGIAGVLLPLILFFAGVRIYANHTTRYYRIWDSALFTVGFLAGLLYICASIASVSMGLYGKHQWDTNLASVTKSSSTPSLILSAGYGPIIWSIKVPIFIMYLHHFPSSRSIRMLSFLGLITTGMFYIAAMITTAVTCSGKDGLSDFNPLTYLLTIASGHCRNTQRGFSITLGVVGVLSDFYLLVLPVGEVRRWEMPLRRRQGVVGMFVVGAAGCVAAVAGLALRVKQYEDADNTWTIVPILCGTMFEIAAGILVVSMPAIPVVFHGHFIHGGAPASEASPMERARTTQSDEESQDTATDEKKQAEALETQRTGETIPIEAQHPT